ncbi:MAG: PrgI family protein [Candidatus Saccharimonadales bacterium]
MAVYKVIQDIEAEDKLLGPLTLKKLIYAALVVFLGFICFRLFIATGLGPLRWLLILTFVLPMILFAVLASPLGREQPTEVWLLSHIKFLFKARRRIWSQDTPTQTVAITAPKKDEKQLVKDISQPEINSRLQALATTLDSRGWAIKNSSVNLSKVETKDSLVKAQNLEPGLSAADDILDEKASPVAQNFQTLMDQAAAVRKKTSKIRLQAARLSAGEAGQPASVNVSTAKETDGLTPEEKQLLDRLHAEDQSLQTQHPVIKKLHADAGVANTVTSSDQAVKLELANAGNALSVASIAHLANRKN